MLYFSDTVCVLTSSSLPALDGALESSNGDANGLCMLFLLLSKPPVSEAQLLRLEDIAEPGREVVGLGDGESWYGRGALPLEGASSISEDGWDETYGGRVGPFNKFLACNPGVGGKLMAGLSNRMVFSKSPPLPELTVICGGLRPGPKPPGVAIFLL